ncbi:MAG: transketolase [Coriobacteriia bacterium]
MTSETTVDIPAVQERARQMRIDIVEMIGQAGSGHPGGSLSAADIVATLYFGGVLRHDPDNPAWPERDRFVLSKGHAAPVLYAALAAAGYFGREHLSTLRKLGSILQGHPDSRKTPGVEVSTGSLGQGLSIANGIALGLGKQSNSNVFCLLGDGECQEGQVWEAAMFAAHHQLDRVIAIVDHNGLQIDGRCREVMDLGEIAEKFRAFGWNVIGADGHDVQSLLAAFAEAKTAQGAPTVVVCVTHKGRGVSFMEDNADWHGKAPSAQECETAAGELCSILEGGGR